MLIKQLAVQEKNYAPLLEELERYLGDPRNPDNVCSYERVVAADEASQFPDEMAAQLSEWGLNTYLVPVALGGSLNDFDEFMLLFRLIHRRDPALGLGYGLTTFMASVVVWVAGDGDQKKNLAEILIQRKKPVSIAYHEPEHGNDFLNSDFSAVREDTGYSLTGSKWLINNAQYGDALTLFAHTGEKKSARDFSLFFLDKKKLDNETLSYVEKIRTVGVRGCRIAGIDFDRCHVNESAVIGKEGEGAEITFRAFQITRTVLPGISVGAADTALRTVTRFTLERKLYGDTVFNIPHARGTLADAFIDLLMCDCVAISGSRSLHVMPEQMSVYSSVVKYFVPSTLESTFQKLSVILGARHYLREGFEWGIFQKMMRDFPVVSAGHASTIICLSSLSTQIRQLASRRKHTSKRDTDIEDRLCNVFDLKRSLPEFDANQLAISSRGSDDVIKGLDLAIEKLKSLESAQDIDTEVIGSIVELADAFLDLREQYETAVLDTTKKSNKADSRYFKYEELYCAVYAASVCLQFWLHNRHDMGEYFERGSWLIYCLTRLLQRYGKKTLSLPDEYVEEAADELKRLFDDNKLFSVLPVELG